VEEAVAAVAVTKEGLKHRSARRRKVQLALWPLVVLTIGLGWKYPLIGFIVPVVMLTGIVGSFVNGRYVCGHLCPRGGFFDRIVKPISPARPIPAWLRSAWFRWPVLVVLMGFMAYQVSRNPGDTNHWGIVFWRICVGTTAVGVLLALVLHQRTWCAFCPMGTMQEAIGGRRSALHLDPGCRGCRTCERACPMNLKIVSESREPGRLAVPDCLKCSECQLACPKQALHF